ncbi:LAFA_0D11980g1_1 [Lachancea sp. 'fantastica']|nr:LAFA_0D11980g1_1 [Lachancea sp. 'fantastica']
MSDLIEPDFVTGSADHTPNPFADPVTDTLPTFGRGTLDEPVAQTLKRDLVQINTRLKEVVYPQFPLRNPLTSVNSDNDDLEGNAHSALQDNHCADLWAPLLFTIAFSVALSRASSRFPPIFVLCWASLAVLAAHLTLNSTTENGKIPFLAAVSTCGYCFFPQVINAVTSSVLLPLMVSFLHTGPLKFRITSIARLFIFFACVFWSCRCSINATKAKRFMNQYPLVLILVTLNWSCLVA